MPGFVNMLRILQAPPMRVYRAFLDAAALSKWLPPHGFTCTVHQLEARERGSYRMTFTNFSTGNSHSFGGTYLELAPPLLLRYTDHFEDSPGAEGMLTTVHIKAAAMGTELSILQEGIPESIPIAACMLGWQESLYQLARLVEPEIPDTPISQLRPT